jgi:predicted PurR-regulated permease PerM
MEEQCSPPWGPVTKLVVVLVILVALAAVFYSFSEAFPPLVIALLIAYVLTPIVNAVSARTRLPRILSTLLIYLAFAVTVGVVVGLLTPPLVRRMTAFQLDLAEVVAAVETLLNRQYTVGEFNLDLSQFYAELQGELASLVRPAVGQTLALVRQAVTTGVWVIFIGVISFYLIKDGPWLGAQLEEWVPPRLRIDYCRLRDEIAGLWRDFLRGQLVVGLAMGGSVLVLMGALGMPNVVVLALLAVALEFLPSLGHAIWELIAVPIALFRGSMWLPLPDVWFAVLILFIHVVLVQVDLNFYIPRFVGRRVHLHPLVVIVGILVGGLLAGVLGIFLAAPIISSLRVLTKYVYCKLLDLPPWPQEEGQPPMTSLSTPGWLQAVWARVEERVRGEREPEEVVE